MFYCTGCNVDATTGYVASFVCWACEYNNNSAEWDGTDCDSCGYPLDSAWTVVWHMRECTCCEGDSLGVVDIDALLLEWKRENRELLRKKEGMTEA